MNGAVASRRRLRPARLRRGHLTRDRLAALIFPKRTQEETSYGGWDEMRPTARRPSVGGSGGRRSAVGPTASGPAAGPVSRSVVLIQTVRHFAFAPPGVTPEPTAISAERYIGRVGENYPPLPVRPFRLRHFRTTSHRYDEQNADLGWSQRGFRRPKRGCRCTATRDD